MGKAVGGGVGPGVGGGVGPGVGGGVGPGVGSPIRGVFFELFSNFTLTKYYIF